MDEWMPNGSLRRRPSEFRKASKDRDWTHCRTTAAFSRFPPHVAIRAAFAWACSTRADEVINKARQRSQAGDACLISGSMAIGTWSAVLASRLRAAACRQHRSLHCRAD